MAEPLQPTALEENRQLFSIVASLFYFVVRDSFFPGCPEDLPPSQMIEHPQSPGILDS